MFRYPGGKNKVRQTIYNTLKERKKHLNDEVEFREPFLGGGAISNFCLKNRLTDKVWINDIDPGIASVWHSVINEPATLIDLIESYTPNVDDFWLFKKQLTDSCAEQQYTKLELAFKKIVVHQFSYSGLGVKAGSPIGGKTQIDEQGNKKKYAFDCRWSPKNIVKEINLFNQRIQGVQIRDNTCTQLDYRSLLLDEKYPGLIYLDPPYYMQGEALYQFFFTDEQHDEMAGILRESKHEWVLSYDNHPRILELYHWAKITPLDITYSINSKGGEKAKEILITRD